MKTSCCNKTKIAVYAAAILGTFLIVSVLVSAMIKYTAPPAVDEDRSALRAKNLDERQLADAQALGSYGWVDKDKGLVRLTLDRSLEVTLEEWQDPEAARAALIARYDAAFPAPVPASEVTSDFE